MFLLLAYSKIKGSLVLIREDRLATIICNRFSPCTRASFYFTPGVYRISMACFFRTRLEKCYSMRKQFSRLDDICLFNLFLLPSNLLRRCGNRVWKATIIPSACLMLSIKMYVPYHCCIIPLWIPSRTWVLLEKRFTGKNEPLRSFRCLLVEAKFILTQNSLVESN